MGTRMHDSAQLGDLVVAAFDEAARLTADPQEVSRLATAAVVDLLQRARERSAAQVPEHIPRAVGRPTRRDGRGASSGA